MFPTFRWVDTGDRFRLAIMPRPDPYALDEHLAQLRADGVDVLVSMLQPEEAVRIGLAEEAAACERAGIRFYNHPVPDHDVPIDREATETFAKEILGELEAGRGVVIHCFAGIGRSATMAATVLVLAGFDLDDACGRISVARNLRVPETPAQIEWLRGVGRS